MARWAATASVTQASVSIMARSRPKRSTKLTAATRVPAVAHADSTMGEGWVP